MEIFPHPDDSHRRILGVLAHFRETTGPLLEAARNITRSELTFSNAEIRQAMEYLARAAEADHGAEIATERAMFHLLLADLNSLKISTSEIFITIDRLTAGKRKTHA